MSEVSFIDPEALYVFVMIKNHRYACPIVHAKDNLLYFTHTQKFVQADRISVRAHQQKGIVIFDTPDVIALTKINYKGEECFLYVLDINDNSFEVTDRRQQPRLSLPFHVPALLNHYGEPMVARIIDVSTTGVKMQSPLFLQPQSSYHLEFVIPTSAQTKIKIKSDAIITYCEQDSISRHYNIGLCFVESPQNPNTLLNEKTFCTLKDWIVGLAPKASS